MRPLAWLFAPDLLAPLAAAVADARDTARRLSSLPAFASPRRHGSRERRAGWPSALGAAVAAGGAGSVAVGVAGLVSPGPAGAQTIEPGLFGEADRPTRDLLAFLSDFDVSTYTALGDMLFVFNGGMLVVAGFLLVWHTVAGTVDTAREGRWGFGGWEIVRIVTAVGLMAPLPGGMNGAQHMVVGLAHLGGDFAAAVWTPFSEDVLGRTGASQPSPPPGGAAIGRLLVAEVCRYAANEAARIAGDPRVVFRQPERTEGAEILHFGGRAKPVPRNLCGAVRYPGLTAAGARGVAAEGYRAAFRTISGAVERLAPDLAYRYVAGKPEYGQPLPDVDAVLAAGRFAERYEELAAGQLGRAAELERDENREALAEDARATNWLAAAGFFNTIAYRIGLFEAAVRDVPQVAMPVPELEEWSAAAAAAVHGVTSALEESAVYNPTVRRAAAASPLAQPTGGNLRLTGGLFDWVDLDNVVVADSGNPVADLARMGHRLVLAALAAVTTLVGAATLSGAVESIPFFGAGLNVFESAWQVGDGFVTTLLGLLMVAGVVLAYVLPALPFIRFLFGVLGWIVSIAAAVLAVTVFAAAHVTRGDGDRLTTSATRQGWLFLPGLILRPPLMLFGLILGYFVFVAAIDLFNAVWLSHLRDAGASDGLDLLGYVAMLAIYVMVAYGLMNGSFKLIEMLPSAALEWIGGRADADSGGEGSVAFAAMGMGRAGGMTRVSRMQRSGGRADVRGS